MLLVDKGYERCCWLITADDERCCFMKGDAHIVPDVDPR